MSLQPPPDPDHAAAAHYAAVGYQPAPSKLPLPTRPVVVTEAVVRAALAANGLGEVRTQVAMMPAGGWIRVSVDGDAKSQRVKAITYDVRRVLAARGLEVVDENAVHTRVRGTYTPTRGDLRFEASRAMAEWFRAMGRENAAWVEHEGVVTRVRGVDMCATNSAASWLERWLDGVGLQGAACAAMWTATGWTAEMRVSRKEAA